MIKSMTGFASMSVDGAVAKVAVTVRTVNHRFLDLHLRTPQTLAASESRLRSLVQSKLARGRVEVSVTVEAHRPTRVDVHVNEPLIAQLSAAIDDARAHGLVEGPITPGDVLRFPQVVSLDEAARDPDEEEALAEAAAAAVSDAVDAVDTMRATEGRHLRADLDARLVALATLVERAEASAMRGATGLGERLTARVQELTANLPVDGTAVAQEVVKFVARSDITEELVRLRSHVDHWRTLSDGAGPCGRKLDFLLQEMNREINTFGAKAEGPEVSEIVIEAKAELERMREQVQNVE